MFLLRYLEYSDQDCVLRVLSYGYLGHAELTLSCDLEIGSVRRSKIEGMVGRQGDYGGYEALHLMCQQELEVQVSRK